MHDGKEFRYAPLALVGSYLGFPVYSWDRVPKEWVAMTTDDGKGVCINDLAYRALLKTPHAERYIDTICSRVMSCGPVHGHSGERSSLEKEIIRYLGQEIGYDDTDK